MIKREKGGRLMPNRRDLARIHMAKKDLGMDDATYRGILRERYRRDSAAELTPSQAADLIALFRAKGWRPSSCGQRGLIRVLWRRLEAAGAVPQADTKALDSFIAHHSGRSGLNHLSVHEASHLIEMLKKWLERAGISDWRH
jgi:phage gp16-like protein